MLLHAISKYVIASVQIYKIYYTDKIEQIGLQRHNFSSMFASILYVNVSYLMHGAHVQNSLRKIHLYNVHYILEQ